MGKRLVIGTRGSRLARIQTDSVARGLREAWPELDVVVETIETRGDRDRNTALAGAGVGFFVKEIEHALLDGRVDLAVHSMKDLPTRVPDGLVVGTAVPERAPVEDCLVTPDGRGPEDLRDGAVVGTGSPRRRAMLLAVRPDLETTPIRGNVETRLAKLEAGACDALVLARAGLARMGLMDDWMHVLPAERFLPAAGQGALGLEHRAGDDEVAELVAAVDHPPSRAAAVAERAVIRTLEGGCGLPVGVLGRAAGEAVRITAKVYDPTAVRRSPLETDIEGPMTEAETLGTELGRRLLDEGAGAMLRPEEVNG